MTTPSESSLEAAQTIVSAAIVLHESGTVTQAQVNKSLVREITRAIAKERARGQQLADVIRATVARYADASREQTNLGRLELLVDMTTALATYEAGGQ